MAGAVLDPPGGLVPPEASLHDLGQVLEAGCFDMLFFDDLMPDTLGRPIW